MDFWFLVFLATIVIPVNVSHVLLAVNGNAPNSHLSAGSGHRKKGVTNHY
jgi:hypothetical protein